MGLSSLPIVALFVALALLLIVRQFQDRPLRPLLLIGAPLGLLVLGGRALASGHRPAAAWGLLGLDLLLALGFGCCRGGSVRVWAGADGPRRQGTRLTAALWLASLAARVGVTLGERATGTTGALAYRELPALLGLTLLTQGGVVFWRATRLDAPAAAA